ncbi:alpha-amylase family glycosyl hydrolase [Polluticaenibacter yanchengensis]|uniref:Alpha-amylase family glycosyl hydrolase n=1 Tax=Polluticaenibacter yanchengensis TaxID=3014562 RepID=A0ABT4UJF1_9BACT|nr:alpha-amylase family glycosyl hydrolase [Chitinophagaceae bacterium LY-5]
MKWIALLVTLLFLQLKALAVQVFPANWWPNMQWRQVELIVYDTTGLQQAGMKVSVNYPGVKLIGVKPATNKNYVYVTLDIAPTAKPGKLNLQFSYTKNITKQVPFTISARRTGKGVTYAQGVTSADFMYLIMPDRFANGNTANDRVAGMRDQSLNRDSIYDRHGGDLEGVQGKLDYLKDLGVTAIWLNPVLENDMRNRTEHGYAFTNHYVIDARLGGAKAYKDLVNAMHGKGMKMIQDAVYNHVGLEHIFYMDLPDSSWFHWWPKFTQTNYREQSIFDPYKAKAQHDVLTNGWFVRAMPDLNQNDIHVERFLIQHALWCVEEFGIDAYRIDTYLYNDLAFMNRCNAALLKEYPKLHLFGETWVHGVLNQSYAVENNLDVPFKSNLPGVTDFQTNLYGIVPALTQDFGWTSGVSQLYNTLAQDFVYKHPEKQVIFLDNHDVSRFMSVVDKDTAKFKMGLTWLLTARGIPQLYYGTEIGMAGVTHPHDGDVRRDFIGGWKEDAVNKFTSEGRTKGENDIFKLVRTLANYRKNTPALHSGKLKHFVPKDGLYIYARYDDQKTILCIMNTSKEAKKIDWNDYKELIGKYTKYKNILTDTEAVLKADYEVGALVFDVLELR